MSGKREKVVVAMSGGVDSSVAAGLLVEQGYEVVGLFMRVGATEPEPPSDSACSPTRASTKQGCCSASDANDARMVAGMLGVPFYALNFKDDFDLIIDHFSDEYIRGRTPNPCVMCNDRLKFGKLVDYADTVGAKYIATGHYARIGGHNDARTSGDPRDGTPLSSPCVNGGNRVLMRGRDEKKDQSYVLFGLERAILSRVMFPIGGYVKAEIRELAARFGFPNRDKPDSVEICFAPDRDYARVVRERRPEAFAEGDVVDAGGEVVGRHKGIAHYTIGQRRGLGIAAGKPIYVTELNHVTNTVTVGDTDALLKRSLHADRSHYLVDAPTDPFRADVKIRYLHKAAPAMVYPLDGSEVRVIFDEPQRAITPGQPVVFYDRDVVLGGAWIDRT